MKAKKKAGSRAKHIDLVADVCRRMPDSPHRAIARKLLAEYPETFANINAAEVAVRRRRGKQGSESRATCNDKSLYERKARTDSPWGTIPQGKRQLAGWKIQEFTRPGWWLVAGDIHIPFHDTAALEAVLDEAHERNVVGILLNGDIVDCHDQSEHEKDPRERYFAEEIDSVRTLLETLRRQFKKSEIVWKVGNHEERWRRFMLKHAPQLLDLADFEWGEVCRVDDYRVKLVDDCQPVSLGKLMVIHGHEYRFAISNPVSPSRGLFLRGGVSAACNHFHRTSQTSKRDLRDNVISTWSIGCLCDLRPRWLPINDWNHGAAFVEVGKDGSYSVDNLRVVDGKLWH